MFVWDKNEKKVNAQGIDMKERYQELLEIKGKITHLVMNTKTIDTKGKKNEKEQIIRKIKTDGTGVDCYKNLREIKKNMVKHEGTRRLCLHQGEITARKN